MQEVHSIVTLVYFNVFFSRTKKKCVGPNL